MMLKQISVFLENRAGRLTQLLKVLSENDIDIRSLSIADTGDYGIVRLVVGDNDKAIKVIKDNNMIVKETDVLAVEINDYSGSLYDVTKLLSENDINFEYAYAAIPKIENKAIVIIKVDNPEKAMKVIADSKFINTVDKI